MSSITCRGFILSFVIVGGVCALAPSTISAEQSANAGDCSPMIAATRVVNGKTVGPTACTVYSQTATQNASGHAFQRIEIGISGTIEGYTAKTGPEPYPETQQFVDYPEFELAQRNNVGPYYHGLSTYTGEPGKSGITLLLPASASDWNGKLYMVFHGGSPYPPLGEFASRKPDRYNPFMGYNNYVGLMMDKGYAVAYTRRSAFKSRAGDREVVLDDATVLKEREHQHHLGVLRDWTELTKNIVAQRLGRPPARTYWYGRSGGATPGRMFNYIAGANRDSKGQKLFDGFLVDDAAGGLIWPTMRFTRVEVAKGVFSVKPDDRDHLTFDDARREEFVPQIDIVHGAYDGNVFVLADYQFMKWENSRLLIEKGLGAKSRTYEIAGVSHGDAGAAYPSERAKQNLDLSGLFDALVDVLDRWADDGVAPASSGVVELPEVACPLGVYYPTKGGAGSTSFAAFLTEPRPAINADSTPLPKGFD
jgi:hypothetical protein